MDEPRIRAILKKTNPGLTDMELDELAASLYVEMAFDVEELTATDKLTVERDLLEQAYNAVKKLKDTYSKIEPQYIDDVVLVNELNVLEFKLADLLNN